MRLVSYRGRDDWRAGLLVGPELVVDAGHAAEAAGLLPDDPCLANVFQSTRRLLELGPETLRRLDAATAESALPANHLGDVELGPPVRDPEKVLCVGLNYRAHVEEFDAAAPESPNLFAKFAVSLLGPHGTIQIPPITDAVDYEGELAVVIGRRCKDVPAASALEYVAGCMAFNDVTARDLQMRTSQWTAGKAIDTFAPCGPALVSLDEIGDPGSLEIRTAVNGTVMQSAATSEMIFPVPEIIAFASRLMTLVPGDIIATGTPEGVGFRRDPPVYLQNGDVVTVDIEGIGRLTNEVALAPRASGLAPTLPTG